jgi:hypothetical protein
MRSFIMMQARRKFRQAVQAQYRDCHGNGNQNPCGSQCKPYGTPPDLWAVLSKSNASGGVSLVFLSQITLTVPMRIGGCPVRGFFIREGQCNQRDSETCKFAMTASGSQTPSSTVGFID